MINNDLLLATDIPILDLIYGEMKSRMYETQCAMEDIGEDSLEYRYLEGLIDAYGYVYNEIDRAIYVRKHGK